MIPRYIIDGIEYHPVPCGDAPTWLFKAVNSWYRYQMPYCKECYSRPFRRKSDAIRERNINKKYAEKFPKYFKCQHQNKGLFE